VKGSEEDIAEAVAKCGVASRGMFPDGGGPGYLRCIWYLSDSKQLSPTARLIITTDEKNGESIFVSAISLVEVIYLAERGRLPPTALQSLENALGDPMGSMVIAPLDAAVARLSRRYPALTSQTCRIGLSPQPPCI
jgi:hypothetical protein